MKMHSVVIHLLQVDRQMDIWEGTQMGISLSLSMTYMQRMLNMMKTHRINCS